MLDYSICPVDIWADILEDQGQDTSVLRAMNQTGYAQTWGPDHSDGRGEGISLISYSVNANVAGCGHNYRLGGWWDSHQAIRGWPTPRNQE